MMNRKQNVRLAAVVLTAIAVPNQAPAQTTPITPPIQFVAEQPAGEWLARVFVGANVQNGLGETVGNVNDLVFDPSGHISTVILGVGGFLGMGEKDVGIPFGALTYAADKSGGRIVMVALTKEALLLAPAFKATEKTTYDVVKDRAVTVAHRASEAAGRLKDQAMKTVEDMKKGEPKQP
jgi:sporulation protein YlmC with PRC-barrel domain